MSANFEKELETYRDRLETLLADQGKFVLIRQQELLGPFETYEAAVTEGYSRFGLESFLVKRIEKQETVQFVSRLIPACP